MMIKWFFIYLWRYIKSGADPKEVENLDWFIRLNKNKTLLRIWRWIHGR